METVSDIGSSAYNMRSHKAKKILKKIKYWRKIFGVVKKKSTVVMLIEMGWVPLTFLFEDQLHESDFSSVALDPKHFTSFIFCQGKVISRYNMVRKGKKRKEKQQDTAW